MFGRPGTTRNGTTNSRTTNSRTTNSGTTNGRTTNSGTTNSGTTNSGTSNGRLTTGSSAAEQPGARPPSTISGWARAIGWGSLAVAGCGAVLLLVAPVEIVGADPQPCEQVRDQVSCSLVQSEVPSTAVPTMVSTPGQVPFARSPTR